MQITLTGKKIISNSKAFVWNISRDAVFCKFKYKLKFTKFMENYSFQNRIKLKIVLVNNVYLKIISHA